MSLVLDSVLIALLSLSSAAAPQAAPAAPKPAPAPKAEPAKPEAAKPDAVKAGAAKPDAAKPDAAKAGAAKPDEAKPSAMAPEVKALVDRMQAFYEKTSDFTARFRQEYTYKAFKRTQISTGTVLFKKPALMRWEYKEPSPRTFVLSGDKVYAYDPQGQTLTKGSINTNQLSASVTFLWGRGHLANEFSIAKVACEKCQGTLLELTPLQPDPRFRKVRLEVDPKSAQVLRSVVVDPDGSENAISFLDLKTNTGVDAEAFKLEPPENVRIIDMTRAQPQ